MAGEFRLIHKDPFDRVLAAQAIVEGVRLVTCLLYTSDAADERSSVDLGGRRIIKKKKYIQKLGRRNSCVENTMTR